MTPDALFADFRARVVGRPVRYRRLATNSLLVYIDGEPGDMTGVTLWFEPTWHLRNQTEVLTGSREAQHDPEAPEPDAGFERAAPAVDVLVGREVIALTVAPVTNDLVLELTGGVIVQTFVSDPATDELWHIRDQSTGQRLIRSGREWKVVEPDV